MKSLKLTGHKIVFLLYVKQIISPVKKMKEVCTTVRKGNNECVP